MNPKLKTLLAILACCSILLAWLIPLHYQPWTTVYNDSAAFLALLFIGLLTLEKPISTPNIIWLIVLVAVIPLLQWQAGIIYFFGDAVIAVCYLMGFSGAILIGYNVSSENSERQQACLIFSTLVIIASIISTWICIRQWLGLQQHLHLNYLEAIVRLDSGRQPSGNLGQPNQLATLLCMGIASVLYLFERRRINGLTGSLIAGFLIFGISLTQSRTPWLGAIFLLIWCAWKGQYIKKRITWRSITAWTSFYVICILSLPTISGLLRHHNTLDLLKHATTSTRLPLWHQFWLALTNGPLWGYGWNQTSLAQTQLSILEKFPHVEQTISSHNILLDLLIWNGPILGGLIIILATIWLSRLALQASTLESSFALLAVGFVLIHGMLEYPLLYAYLLLPVGFLLGIVNRETHRLSKTHESNFKIPQTVFSTILLIAALLMVRILQEYKYFDNDHSVSVNTEIQTKFREKSTGLADHTFFLTQLNESLRMDITDPSTNMTAQQLEWMRKVAHRYASPFHLYTYAAALALNNQPQQAIHELQYIKIYFGDLTYQAATEQIIALQNQLYTKKQPHQSQNDAIAQQ